MHTCGCDWPQQHRMEIWPITIVQFEIWGAELRYSHRCSYCFTDKPQASPRTDTVNYSNAQNAVFMFLWGLSCQRCGAVLRSHVVLMRRSSGVPPTDDYREQMDVFCLIVNFESWRSFRKEVDTSLWRAATSLDVTRELSLFWLMYLRDTWLQSAGAAREHRSTLGSDIIRCGQSLFSAAGRKKPRTNGFIWHWLVSRCVAASWNHRHNKSRLRGWPLCATPRPARARCSRRGVQSRPPSALLMELLQPVPASGGEMLIVNKRGAFTRWDPPGPGNCNSH